MRRSASKRQRPLELSYWLGVLMIALSIMALAYFAWMGPSTNVTTYQRETPVEVEIIGPKVVTCTEDMPCWDCTRMGNLICGHTHTGGN